MIDREAVRAICERILPELQQAARKRDWALAVHGSQSRDLDLIAVPWTDDACSEAELVETIRLTMAQQIGGEAFIGAGGDGRTPGYKVKPNGRRCWTLHGMADFLSHGEEGVHPYIDLSILDFRVSGPPPFERPVPPKAQLVTHGAGLWGVSSKAEIGSKP